MYLYYRKLSVQFYGTNRILGNFSNKQTDYQVPAWAKKIVINNYEDADIDGNRVRLKPYQALVFESDTKAKE